MDIFEKCKRIPIADEAKAAGIYPYFHSLTSRQDTSVQMSGRQVIMLGSNNYLGLTSHPEVTEAGKRALDKYGSGCSGSRFLNGTMDIHIALERELSDFLGKEDSVTFGTGFQSNLGIISGIAGRNDIIFCDRENHASIYDGSRLSYAKFVRYAHSDMADLEAKLSAAAGSYGKLIVTDGVFSMSGDICKLPEIVALAKKYGARVMVDDAHGLGVLGRYGKGTAEYFGLTEQVDIIMGTFSKSLASLGGYMAADAVVCEYIRHASRPFIFSASMTPANVECARAALGVLKREPERVSMLSEISDYMRGLLKGYGIAIKESSTPIIPIYTYGDAKTFYACKLLLEKGVYVNPVVSPATPVGEGLLRTSYTATHTKQQMALAAKLIKETLDELSDFSEEDFSSQARS